MRQVDNFWKTVIIVLSSITLLFIMTGCSSKNLQPLSSQQVFDDNVTQDQLLNAVKKVFVLSNKDKFIIEAFRDKIHVIKPRLSYEIFDPIPQNDYFDFKIKQGDQNGSLSASLSISRKNILEDQNASYLDPQSFSYRLFWERLAFLLGKSDICPKCKYTSDDFLCDTNNRENTIAHITKDEQVHAAASQKRRKIQYKTIDLNDIIDTKKNYSPEQKPNQTIPVSPKIKREKRGTHNDSITEKTLKLKDVGIKNRKPEKTPIKSLNEENSKKEK